VSKESAASELRSVTGSRLKRAGVCCRVPATRLCESVGIMQCSQCWQAVVCVGEAAALKIEDLQLREGHWVLADLNGKGGHIRTVPVPDWVKTAIDQWAIPASIISGTLFRSINKAGRVWGTGFTPKVIWSIVKQAASNSGLSRVAPHNLRRTCAKLCHEAGGELEQIQFLLGHVSVQTTERYLGCKQRFRNAVNDHIGLEPGSS